MRVWQLKVWVKEFLAMISNALLVVQLQWWCTRNHRWLITLFFMLTSVCTIQMRSLSYGMCALTTTDGSSFGFRNCALLWPMSTMRGLRLLKSMALLVSFIWTAVTLADLCIKTRKMCPSRMGNLHLSNWHRPKQLHFTRHLHWKEKNKRFHSEVDDIKLLMRCCTVFGRAWVRGQLVAAVGKMNHSVKWFDESAEQRKLTTR